MKVIEELEAKKAILHNRHLVLKSGRHASDYINLDFIFPDGEFMSALGYQISRIITDPRKDAVEALVAPATGGVALLQWVGMHVRDYTGVSPLLLWADKQPDGSFAFERADWASRLDGRWVVGIEDVTTTGGSLAATLEAAEQGGAEVMGAVAVCNRGGADAKTFGVEWFEALASVDYPSYTAADCPMCAQERPIVEDVGHGAEFKAAHPDYPGGYAKLLG